MRQIENKAYGEVLGFNGALGRAKMIAANKVAAGDKLERKRKAKASQNAYRAAIGLPPK